MTTQADVQSTIDGRKRRWNEFLKPDAAPGFLFKVGYQDNSLPPAPPHWPEKAKERVEYKWVAYQRALERVAEIDDDCVPYIDMFREFVYPELASLSARYGGLGMHCCADARHQWENLKSVPGLRLLNFCNPPTRKPEEYIGDALTFFAGTCAQWHCGWSPDLPAERWPEGYPQNCRVVIEPWAADKASAIPLAEQLRAYRR